MDELESEGVCIPNFFVTRKREYFDYLKQPTDVKILDEYPILKSAFVQTGLIYCFDFFKTSSVDSLGNKIDCVYAGLK